MKNFVVIHSPSTTFSVVVMATGLELPQNDLEEVAQELRQRHINGNVVFDLLTSNGSRTRRFFAIGFDGEKFSPGPGLKSIEPEETVREAAANYLYKHFAEFDLSLLTPAMRFAAQRGIPL
jgi:hypothetical protein